MSKPNFHLMMICTILLMLSAYSCSSITYTIKGRVIDAETEKPIEGAVVAVHWYHYRFIPRFTGMTSGFETIAVYESLTDSEGYFETTKHLSGYSNMGIYKKGYICWSDDYVFTHDELNYMDYAKPREESAPINSGMEIRLSPFRDEKEKYKHADFVNGVVELTRGRKGDSIFTAMTIEEIKLHYEKH